MAKTEKNPFTPGAGYPPPFLAGRQNEIQRFGELLEQDIVLKNPIVTGLRGVGKTVLLAALQPIAEEKGWVWVGTELSETVFVSEETACNRLITDLAFFTSTLGVLVDAPAGIGIGKEKRQLRVPLDYGTLMRFFQGQPGLLVDKLKATFELAWPHIKASKKKGVIFAYDEAQVVADQNKASQYPLALMLGLFQSLQSKGMCYMLLLAGLPTLFSKLVASRTYSERMFTVQTLDSLEREACKAAIETPLKDSPLKFKANIVEKIIHLSGGYPYFIQFLCRECFEHFRLQLQANPKANPEVPEENIIAKLDSDFFAGRWANVTDRQRDLLFCISSLDDGKDSFNSVEIVATSKSISKKNKAIRPFNKSDVAQILPKLIERGLIYKTRHGSYALAIPMFAGFISRQLNAVSK